tara:strand:+ start:209 stop:943 length:735 start_codon:yes stop_codon:yes gene_type:complete
VAAPKKYKNREERLAAKRRYHHKNKDKINAKRRAKYIKKPKSKYKNCTSCGKLLEKNYKNFRYISKKNNILRFRPLCRPCERKSTGDYAKTPTGKEMKKKAQKRYAISGKKKKSQKKYYDKNRDKLNQKNIARRAIKRKIDPHTRIRDNLSLRMRLALKEQNLTKRNTTANLVGCSIPFLKKYLENKFQKGMNWKNQGRYGWHIDHIKPCSKFDLSDPDQQKKCFNYKNLQPLWAEENIKKSNN